MADPAMNPAKTASTVVAVLQGGYVLARVAGSTEPFEHAVAGVLELLARQATTPATPSAPAQ